MRFFTFNKFICSFILLFLTTVSLKWGMDVCLPYHPESRLFSRSLAAPDNVCEQIIGWDAWARSHKAVSDASENVFTRSDIPWSSSDIIIFSTDFQELPVTLSLVPFQLGPTLRLLAALLVWSLLMAIVWQITEAILLTPVRIFRSASTPAPRRMTATMKILPAPETPIYGDLLTSRSRGRYR